MDWMYDELFNGKRIWVLTVVDTYSRVCPVMRVTRAATAMVVIEALEQARRSFGLPHTIRVDQGCQFTSKELDLWAYANDVTWTSQGPESQLTMPTSKASTPRLASNASASTGLWIWTTRSRSQVRVNAHDIHLNTGIRPRIPVGEQKDSNPRVRRVPSLVFELLFERRI